MKELLELKISLVIYNAELIEHLKNIYYVAPGILSMAIFRRNSVMRELNFTPFPEMTTKHFILRSLNISDENEIFKLRSDEAVRQYLDRPKAKSIEDARQFIEKIKTGIAGNELIYWVVRTILNPQLIGTICLWNISREHSRAEIGFELLPEHFGKGIMQEVIPAIIEYGFEKLKLISIEAEVDPFNLKSIVILEKNGFVFNRKNEKTVVYSLINEKLAI